MYDKIQDISQVWISNAVVFTVYRIQGIRGRGVLFTAVFFSSQIVHYAIKSLLSTTLGERHPHHLALPMAGRLELDDPRGPFQPNHSSMILWSSTRETVCRVCPVLGCPYSTCSDSILVPYTMYQVCPEVLPEGFKAKLVGPWAA